MSQGHLSSEERYVIYHLRVYGLSRREIGPRLGRAHHRWRFPADGLAFGARPLLIGRPGQAADARYKAAVLDCPPLKVKYFSYLLRDDGESVSPDAIVPGARRNAGFKQNDEF